MHAHMHRVDIYGSLNKHEKSMCINIPRTYEEKNLNTYFGIRLSKKNVLIFFHSEVFVVEKR